MFANLFRSKISGNDGEQLFIISLCKQIYDRSHHVAKIHHLSWFCAEIVNAQHILLRKLNECLIVCLAQISNVFGVCNLDSIVSLTIRIWNGEKVKQLLECFEQGALAVTTFATKQDAELTAITRYPVCHLAQLSLGIFRLVEVAVAKFHLSHNCSKQTVVCLFRGHGQSKTRLHSPPL